MKFTCFIDASSYINLSFDDCYLNGKTLLKILQDHVNIKFCSKVNGEISRHQNSLMPTSLERSSKIYQLKFKGIKTYKKYEEFLFDNVSKPKEKNIGEKPAIPILRKSAPVVLKLI